jgi:hypothetical protein
MMGGMGGLAGQMGGMAMNDDDDFDEEEDAAALEEMMKDMPPEFLEHMMRSMDSTGQVTTLWSRLWVWGHPQSFDVATGTPHQLAAQSDGPAVLCYCGRWTRESSCACSCNPTRLSRALWEAWEVGP